MIQRKGGERERQKAINKKKEEIVKQRGTYIKIGLFFSFMCGGFTLSFPQSIHVVSLSVNDREIWDMKQSQKGKVSSAMCPGMLFIQPL